MQIVLSGGIDVFRYPLDATIEQVQADLDKVWLPFKPLRPDLVHYNGEEKIPWLYTCPRLGDDGRCTIYHNRPGLCRTFEPGSDALCVHFRKEDGNPIIPLLPPAKQIKP